MIIAHRIVWTFSKCSWLKRQPSSIFVKNFKCASKRSSTFFELFRFASSMDQATPTTSILIKYCNLFTKNSISCSKRLIEVKMSETIGSERGKCLRAIDWPHTKFRLCSIRLARSKKLNILKTSFNRIIRRCWKPNISPHNSNRENSHKWSFKLKNRIVQTEHIPSSISGIDIVKFYAHAFFHIFFIVVSSCSIDNLSQWSSEFKSENMFRSLIEVA